MTVGIEFIYKSNAGNGVAFRHWGGTHATVKVRLTWLTPSFNLGKIFTDYINDFDTSVFSRASSVLGVLDVYEGPYNQIQAQ